MDRELKNKYLDMLMDTFPNELAINDFKSILENIARDDKLRGHRHAMFTVFYEVIPECIDNIDLELLWKFTRENKYLEEFKIPARITNIADYAFSNCINLKSIEIPSSVTSIGGGAFEGCNSLTSIVIPSSVTSIGYAVFDFCNHLTDIKIPSSVTSIGKAAFRSCSSLTSITIPNSVTSIEGGAFYNCRSLKSITIPSSVTSIGNFVFYGCKGLTVKTKNPYVIDYCKKYKIKYQEEI